MQSRVLRGRWKIGREERGSRASDLVDSEDAMNTLLYSSEKRRLPLPACLRMEKRKLQVVRGSSFVYAHAAGRVF